MGWWGSGWDLRPDLWGAENLVRLARGNPLSGRQHLGRVVRLSSRRYVLELEWVSSSKVS